MESSEFDSVKQRLEEIAQAVADENMPLDEALDLYEEAVALGLKASDLLEVGIVVEDPEKTFSQIEPVGTSSSSPGSPQSSGDNSATGMTFQPSTSSNQDPSTD